MEPVDPAGESEIGPPELAGAERVAEGRAAAAPVAQALAVEAAWKRAAVRRVAAVFERALNSGWMAETEGLPKPHLRRGGLPL